MNNHPKILKVLNTTPEEVSESVMRQSCKDSNLFTVNEGLMWVFNTIGKTDEAKKLKAEQ